MLELGVIATLERSNTYFNNVILHLVLIENIS